MCGREEEGKSVCVRVRVSICERVFVCVCMFVSTCVLTSAAKAPSELEVTAPGPF